MKPPRRSEGSVAVHTPELRLRFFLLLSRRPDVETPTLQLVLPLDVRKREALSTLPAAVLIDDVMRANVVDQMRADEEVGGASVASKPLVPVTVCAVVKLQFTSTWHDHLAVSAREQPRGTT